MYDVYDHDPPGGKPKQNNYPEKGFPTLEIRVSIRGRRKGGLEGGLEGGRDQCHPHSEFNCQLSVFSAVCTAAQTNWWQREQISEDTSAATDGGGGTKHAAIDILVPAVCGLLQSKHFDTKIYCLHRWGATPRQ